MAPVTPPVQPTKLITPDYVHHWAKELNVENQSTFKLKGGINNHVYRCGTERNAYVIKGYQGCPVGTRDRMNSEVEFLAYANEIAPEFVPRLIRVDWQQRCVVLEHLPGESYHDGYIPGESEIEVAYEFAKRLNTDYERAKQLITMRAADGHVRVTEHLKNVSDRMKQMTLDHLPASQRKHAQTLISRLQLQYEETATNAIKLIGTGEIIDAVNEEKLCISPSDFGFHNAIRSQNAIKFIDFEFSGWDDPAKMIVDFFLQPKIPIRPIRPEIFANSVFSNDTQGILKRCVTLAPILKAKWLCIILAVLNPARINQLMMIHAEIPFADLIRKRLDLATRVLNERTEIGVY
jgi:hypothetical protein